MQDQSRQENNLNKIFSLSIILEQTENIDLIQPPIIGGDQIVMLAIMQIILTQRHLS